MTDGFLLGFKAKKVLQEKKQLFTDCGLHTE